MKDKLLHAAAAVLMSGGVGIAGLAASSGIAHAQPEFVPLYHWCPGDFWDPGWGFNWEWTVCHDDWHRDIDGDWHDRDWHPDPDRDWHPDGDPDWHPDRPDRDWHPDRGDQWPWWQH